MSAPQPGPARWPVCTRDGALHHLRWRGASTYGLHEGKLTILAGLTGKRVYLELHGGGYRTVCCEPRARQDVDVCDCVEKYVIWDLVAYFTEHLADFHEHWHAWRDSQYTGDHDEWFDQNPLWATMPSTHPDIAVIAYAGQWLWARVHGDLMRAYGGGPDDYRVTLGWEEQLLNTVWPLVAGFTPPPLPTPGHAEPGGCEAVIAQEVIAGVGTSP